MLHSTCRLTANLIYGVGRQNICQPVAGQVGYFTPTIIVLNSESCICWNTTKMHLTMKTESSVIKQLLQAMFLPVKVCIGIRHYMEINSKVCSVTSEPSWSSRIRVTSFKDLWGLILIASTLQLKYTWRWKQSSAIKQLLETALHHKDVYWPLALYWWTLKCAVSLANHLRAVADAYCLLRTR